MIKKKGSPCFLGVSRAIREIVKQASNIEYESVMNRVPQEH